MIVPINMRRNQLGDRIGCKGINHLITTYTQSIQTMGPLPQTPDQLVSKCGVTLPVGIEVQSIQQRALAQDVSTTDRFITEERKYIAQDVSTTDKEVLTEGQ